MVDFPFPVLIISWKYISFTRFLLFGRIYAHEFLKVHSWHCRHGMCLYLFSEKTLGSLPSLRSFSVLFGFLSCLFDYAFPISGGYSPLVPGCLHQVQLQSFCGPGQWLWQSAAGMHWEYHSLCSADLLLPAGNQSVLQKGISAGHAVQCLDRADSAAHFLYPRMWHHRLYYQFLRCSAGGTSVQSLCILFWPNKIITVLLCKRYELVRPSFF